jgi:uncharacterized small protein (DUF1192 family)
LGTVISLLSWLVAGREECTAFAIRASVAASGPSFALDRWRHLPLHWHDELGVCAMDLDDLLPPKKQSGLAIGDQLETLSVSELEKRIKDLEAEIVRVRLEIDRKKRHEEAAHALFKS